MRKLARATWVALLATFFACVAGASPPDKPAPLTVFAAASLKESLDEAATAYERGGGAAVRVSYAASSALARQIEQGAPADVFVSADLDWMDALQKQKLIDPASRRNLLGNTLVLVAPKESKVQVALKPGLDLAALLGADGRLALALTNSVPAGKYAKQSLVKLGAWDGVKSRTAEAENVRAALLLVARGEAPLGIVYGSDALAEPTVRVVGTFPADTHAPIVYPIARVAASAHPQAKTFVQWLQTPAARAIFARHGFRLL
jgi:molybdate transport system substrate-binding protein